MNPTHKSATRTIGIDLGDKKSYFTIRDSEGEVVERGQFATSPESFREFFSKEPGTLVAYEAGIKHNGPTAHAHRAVVTVRAALVTARTKCVNVARGIVKSLGGRFPTCSAESFHKRVPEGDLHPAAIEALAPLLKTIGELTQKIRQADREIERVAREVYPVTNVLRQIAGVGSITALTFVLRIEDPERFTRSRDVGGYLGLVPKERQSGNDDPELGITKAGDSYLRTLLVQASQYILGPFAPDTDLRRFGERLAARGGKAAKKRAVIALARKLAILLHRLWVTGEVYEPLRNSNCRTAA